MKGFARIFEAIIASIMLIAALTFFFSDQTKPTTWDGTNLQTISQDVLQAAYLNGTITTFVKLNDKQSINARISDMLPRTVDFSIQVNGIPNDVIKIACVDCVAVEENELNDILNASDFEYHGRPVSVRTETLDLASEEIKDGTNTLFFFDKSKLTTYRQKIDNFLANGGSVVLFDTIAQADTTGYAGQLFNLTWAGLDTQNAKFYDPYGGRNISHFVAKYYANLTGKDIQDTESDTFSVLGSSGVAATQDDRTILVGGSRAYARANYQINRTKGRSVWFSEYSGSHSNPSIKAADRAVLASIMWASGESYSMDIAKKIPAPVHFTSEIAIFDMDTYIFRLTVWQAFF